MNKFFADIYKNDSNHSITYRSGMTVYQESIADNKFSALGWNGAGFPLDILDDFPTFLKPKDFPHTEIFRVDVNGISQLNGWKYNDFYTEKYANGSIHSILTVTSAYAEITVKIHTVIDGTAILTRWLEFTNDGDSAINLGNLTVMGGGLETLDNWREYVHEEDLNSLYSLGYFEKNAWANEGAFRWHHLTTARTTVSGHYQKNHFRHPMCMLKNNQTGAIWFAQLGYSGGWSVDVDAICDGNSAHLSFAFRIDGENPVYTLQKGETYATPKLHIGMMLGSFDDIVNEMHAHTRRTVYTLPEPLGKKGGLVECGMGPERIMNVEYCKHFIDTAAKVGAEAFIIDAGWYCPLGTASQEWFPRVGDWEANNPSDISKVRDYAHSKGMLFGLWASIEQMMSKSKIYSERSAWLTKTYDGEETTVLDFSNPEVVKHIEKVFDKLVNEYGIDLFRLDYNVGGFNVHFRNELGEDGCARYYDNLYKMFNTLRKRYPDVVFENCASGGMRTDLGIMENFTHTWVSDHQIAPRSVQITNGMTMVLPPERVDRLASGMNSHKYGTLDLIIRHTLFGRPSTNDYNILGTQFNPNQIEFVRHCYDIFKTVIRPFAPSGKIYHHTPEAYATQTKGTIILERSSETKDAGVIGIFRLCGDNSDFTVVYPRGIRIDAEYEVTFDNSSSTIKLSGYEMINNGLRISIPNNLSSELIIYKQI